MFLSDPEVAALCMCFIPCKDFLRFVLDSEVIACWRWFIPNSVVFSSSDTEVSTRNHVDNCGSFSNSGLKNSGRVALSSVSYYTTGVLLQYLLLDFLKMSLTIC